MAPQRRSQRHVGGGHMQQSNAVATALYDHAAGGGPLHNAGPAGDAVMARWLQSAGLQHLASPLASTGIDQRLLPNLLMQVTNALLWISTCIYLYFPLFSIITFSLLDWNACNLNWVNHIFNCFVFTLDCRFWWIY